MSYVYKRTEPGLLTVGFYAPDGSWHPDSDHQSSDEAAKRVAWLNGSKTDVEWDYLMQTIEIPLSDLRPHLKRAGEEGWELVHLHSFPGGTNFLIWKRSKR